MRRFELKIPKMVCSTCSGAIETSLRGCKKVKVIKVSPNFMNHTVIVEIEDSNANHDFCIEALKGATEDAGFETESAIDISKIIRNYWIKGILGVLSGAAIMALAITGVGIPLALGASVGAFTLLLGRETYQDAVTQLVKNKKLSMESLFTVSTLLAVGVSCAAFFVPWLPMMFDAALFILGFKNIGKAIEESAKQTIENKSFQSLVKDKITIELNPENLQEISVDELKEKDIIVVYSGETVPVDGECLDKNTSIDCINFTGESLPQSVVQGQPILAGSVVPDHIKSIRICVTHNKENSELVCRDRHIQRIVESKASWETATQKILQYFIPAVFGIAAISALVTGLLISPVAAIQCAISVLVSACPCVLGLVTAFDVHTAIAKAAKYNIFFKEADSIEKATEIDTVVFDLNGTLTTGIPKVVKSTVPREFLAHLLKIEKQSSHPMAKAICGFVEEEKFDAQDITRCEVNSQHDGGVTAELDVDDHFVVGNEEMMKSQGIATNAFEREVRRANAEHVVYVAKNKEIVGYLLLTDSLRDDAVSTVRELQRQGKAVHICTGASKKTAEKYADQLGIPRSHVAANRRSQTRNTSAQTKTEYIERLQRKNQSVGKRGVAAIGDSGNDAEMVVKSNFSVAVKSAYGSRITQDRADAVINHNSLWSIVHTFAIAKQTVANIKQNLAISFGYNLLSLIAFSGLLVALGVAVNPVLGAVLMIVQTGLVLMNVARFKHQKLPEVPDPATVSQSEAEANWESTDSTLQKRFWNKAQPSCSARPSSQQQALAKGLSWSGFSAKKSSLSVGCQNEIELMDVYPSANSSPLSLS